MSVDAIIENVLKREKGYVNHPSDRGGPTNWGITQATYSAYLGRQATVDDVRDMPRETAKAIYKKQYVDEPKFSSLVLVSEAIADEVVDTGVNMGPKTACVFLQRALNVLNRQATDYPDVAVDGNLGPATMNALLRFLEKRGKAMGEIVLLRVLNALQGARYVEIAEKNRNQEDFVYGWFRERVVI